MLKTNPKYTTPRSFTNAWQTKVANLQRQRGGNASLSDRIAIGFGLLAHTRPKLRPIMKFKIDALMLTHIGSRAFQMAQSADRIIEDRSKHNSMLQKARKLHLAAARLARRLRNRKVEQTHVTAASVLYDRLYRS